MLHQPNLESAESETPVKKKKISCFCHKTNLVYSKRDFALKSFCFVL